MGVGISESWRGAELRCFVVKAGRRRSAAGFLSKVERKLK
jgi:hypothetical protein